MSLSADGGIAPKFIAICPNGETKALNFGTGQFVFFSEAVSETYVLEVPTIYDVYVMTMEGDIPSGELTFCHGKSPFLMGKSTINGHFQ